MAAKFHGLPPKNHAQFPAGSNADRRLRNRFEWAPERNRQYLDDSKMPNETALRARTNAAPIISRYWAAPEIWSRANAVPADARHLPLTDRQLECLRWISLGKSSPDIGVILSISGRTVDYHVNAICERLGVRTRMQAVAHAIRRGWLIADHIS